MKKEELYLNKFYLKGMLKNIFKASGGKGRNECIIVTIHVGNGNHPQVVCWEQNAKSILKHYKINDTICLLANLQSSQRIINGKKDNVFFILYINFRKHVLLGTIL